MNRTISIISCLAMGAVLCVSCGHRNTVQPPVQVETYELKDTSCVISHTYPATISGIQDVAIYPQVSGRITAIKVTEGQYVKVNDVLFEIDDVPYKSAFEQAEAMVEVAKAKLETARLTFQSKQNLFSRNIISEYQLKLAENEVKTSEAELGQAEAGLRNAQNNLSFTKVRTMGKGLIGQLPLKVGSLVGPTIPEPLTYVSDNSSIYADFSVPENVFLMLELSSSKGENDNIDDDLTLITNLGEEYPYKGRLHSASGLISQNTGALPIRSVFPNPDGMLLSGGSCQVVIRENSEKELMIPRSAIKEVQNMMFVFRVTDGVIHQVAVKAERYDAKMWILLKNDDGSYPLKAGDVITATTNRLHDGDKVETINPAQ